MSDRAPIHDAFAADYDRQAKEYRCFIPEILFGLCFEYVKPGDRLLDVGIGTGLSAAPFAKAGVKVSGLDESAEMLGICRAKGVAAELKQLDINARPWPFAEGAFEHVISCGVFHFIEDLGSIFSEASRLIRTGGIFAFTAKAPPPDSKDITRTVIQGIPIYSHSPAWIEGQVTGHGFETLKEASVLIGDDLFRAYVTRKKEADPSC